MSFRRLIALAALPLVLAGCSAPSFEVTPRILNLDLDGSFRAGSGASNSSSSWDRLGLDDEPTDFSPRLDLYAGAMQLTFDAAQGRYSGNGALDGQIDLDGVTIPASASVDSDLDFGIYRLTSTFDLLPSERGQLGIGVGLAAVDVKASIVDTLTTNSANTDELVPVPYAALRAGVDFGDLEVQGLLGVLSLDVGDNEATYVDADVYARYFLLGGEDHVRAAIVLGYRSIDLDVSYDDGDDRVDFDVQVSGPYLGVTVVF
ncbi:MAG: hypothetical protein R3F34_00430 [Planctomycetota bacterium]